LSLRSEEVKEFMYTDHGSVAVLRNLKLPGFTYVGKKTESTHAPGRRSKDLHRLSFGWEAITARREKKSENAKKGAETRKIHNDICGSGADACILRADGCTAWRKWRGCCSHRRTALSDLDNEALDRFTNATDVTPLVDLQRSALLHRCPDFQCATENNRLTDVVYCGVTKGTSLSGTWRLLVGGGIRSRRTLKKFASWEHMAQWIRRWAPWELPTLEDVEKEAPAIEIPILTRALFHGMQNIHYIHVDGMFGGSHHNIDCYKLDFGYDKVARSVTAWGDGHTLRVSTFWDFWRINGGFTGNSGLLPP